MARWTAVLTVLAALAWPGSALAIDRYVDDSGSDTLNNCAGPVAPCATIGHAITQAGDGDTIRIGAGDYAEGLDAIDKALGFEGAARVPPGAAFDPNVHTRVVSPDNGQPAFGLNQGGALRHLSAIGRSASAPTDMSPAIVVRSNAGAPFREVTIDDVTAEGGVDTDTDGGGDSSQPALFVPNPLANNLKLTAEDSVFSVAESAGAVVQVDFPDVELTLRRVAVREAGTGFTTSGIEINGGAQALVQQLDIDSGDPGLLVGIQAFPTHLTLDRSRIATQTGSPLQIGGTGTEDGDATITDSLLVGGSGSSTLETSAGGTSSMLTELFNSTVVMSGDAHALDLASFASGESSAHAVNSIFRAGGPGLDVRALGSGSDFTASSSSWTTHDEGGGATAPAPGSGTNIAGNPQLAGDFSLLSGSPLVDRGDPTGVTGGQLDLAGTPRSLDGNRDCVAVPDVGAFELTGFGAPCPASPAAGAVAIDRTKPVLGSLRLSSAVFRAAKSGASISGKAKAKVGTKVTFTLSEASRVRFTVQRKTRGRKVGKRCRAKKRSNARKKPCTRWVKVKGSFTVAGKAGRNSFKFRGRIGGKSLKRGRYRLSGQAVDSANNKSVFRRKRFRIVR